MLISEFNFELPPELIAQEPLVDRKASRMLVVDRSSQSFSDRRFAALPKFLRSGDVLVLNNTKVFPARLLGRSETGANIELFLVRETADGNWETLARPARRLHSGKRVHFGDELTAEVVNKTEDGKVFVRFECTRDFYEVLDEIGMTPLPPYIKRESSAIDSDRERYQTVFAKNRGAIAAPTAGLHFTPEVLEDIKDIGVTVAEITLHVGYGTFEPVRVDDLTQHQVSAERYAISDETAEILNGAKSEKRRIVAVGTTATRALETTLTRYDSFLAGSHSADLTITPGYKFRAIDALLTNFHLPLSSLLVLTSTFGGHELIMSAYRHAIIEEYRFYSYGDCMFVV
ncbi:MAG TPA: tRNA preQ1(34) S-adenosylmethionine ribosyltransferase-isomerase QueA [Pyrinomonadaceae bacterium]|nr:tRNA preQ1(34) S-adenosylmethionine ribosyltransferase-isomerase QueA [Acidobacteriota bacterium]HQZ96284.1 tRNA preQ1(34) S-adenosylmethionine ribosyltransferase-isomerase QueA [Pyrinomonadaceae bacterium]